MNRETQTAVENLLQKTRILLARAKLEAPNDPSIMGILKGVEQALLSTPIDTRRLKDNAFGIFRVIEDSGPTNSLEEEIVVLKEEIYNLLHLLKVT